MNFNIISIVSIDTMLLIFIAIIISGIVSSVLAMFLMVTKPNSRVGVRLSLIRISWFSGLPFAIVGIVAGYMTGLSRQAAVGALVPAALTLIGGVGVYLYGKSRKSALISTFTILNFTILLLFGVMLGAHERQMSEEQMKSIEYKKRMIEEEFLIERYKKGLGIKK